MLNQYAYHVPPELIANEPASPRDSARLLVYDTARDQIEVTTFRDLAAVLPPQSLLVFNDTKVVPARLRAISDRGDTLELLLLVDEGMTEGNRIRGLVSRFVAVGEVLRVGEVSFLVIDNREKWMELQSSAPYEDILTVLYRQGTTPIPPYIKNTVLSEAELRVEYQSVFASAAASVAAPTASLHFTPTLLEALQAKGHESAMVTLHVGLGTFSPVLPEYVKEQRLHAERYAVSAATALKIKKARDDGRPVVAVGTTVVRTLESAREKLCSGEATSGMTDLFIRPPYTFSFPDALITNFHVSRSSLMCMVDAFLEHKKAPRSIITLYEYAIKERFRFYSFGDGMLIY